MVLRAMASQEHRTVILGAWGCGVFRNDPQAVAEAFARWLRGPLGAAFDRVVFAVYERGTSGPNRSAFASVFGDG